LARAARPRRNCRPRSHVAVEVEAYRPFFILGEVTLPGQYPYVANMTVETAVAIAGGYTPRAQKQRIEVSRHMSGMTEKRVVSPNYPVRPGDTIKIAERWF
jgi:polysaccharide export outer membrane protein